MVKSKKSVQGIYKLQPFTVKDNEIYNTIDLLIRYGWFFCFCLFWFSSRIVSPLIIDLFINVFGDKTVGYYSIEWHVATAARFNYSGAAK